MENDSEYKNGFPSINVDKESVLKMLTKVASFKMEERDLALDRFKRCNEDMEDEVFFLHGKTAIMYLDSASKASNYLGDIAKDMLKLAFETSSPTGDGPTQGNYESIANLASSMIKDRRLNRGNSNNEKEEDNSKEEDSNEEN